jgi:hypothetical protein
MAAIYRHPCGAVSELRMDIGNEDCCGLGSRVGTRPSHSTKGVQKADLKQKKW